MLTRGRALHSSFAGHAWLPPSWSCRALVLCVTHHSATRPASPSARRALACTPSCLQPPACCGLAAWAPAPPPMLTSQTSQPAAPPHPFLSPAFSPNPLRAHLLPMSLWELPFLPSAHLHPGARELHRAHHPFALQVPVCSRGTATPLAAQLTRGPCSLLARESARPVSLRLPSPWDPCPPPGPHLCLPSAESHCTQDREGPGIPTGASSRLFLPTSWLLHITLLSSFPWAERS